MSLIINKSLFILKIKVESTSCVLRHLPCTYLFPQKSQSRLFLCLQVIFPKRRPQGIVGTNFEELWVPLENCSNNVIASQKKQNIVMTF